MNGLRPAARAYIVGVVAAAACALGAALAAAPVPNADLAWLVAALAAGVALAWTFPILFARERGGYVDAAPAFAALLLLPPGWAMLAAAVGTAAAHALRRSARDPVQALFNAAQTALGLGVGAVVLAAGGWQAGWAGLDGPADLVVVLAGGVATFLANGALLATMIGLQTGRSPVATWVRTIGQGPRGSVLLYATLLDLALVAAVVAVDRVWQVALVAPPVVLGLGLLRQQARDRLGAEAALRLARVGTWRWDLGTNACSWSPEAQRILGIDPGQDAPTGPTVSAAIHPADRPRLAALLATASDGGAPREAEIRLLQPDGRERVVRLQGEAESGCGGRPARVIGTILDVTDQRQREAALTHRATHDPLTDLPNRDLLRERLERALAAKGDEVLGVAVLFLDLDGFKAVNDALGHAAGDELLVAVARRLRDRVRGCDTAARFGGDEFVVLLDGVVDREEATAAAESLARALRRPYELPGALADTSRVEVAVSIGVAWAAAGQGATEAMLREADLALRAAKAQGKDRVVACPEHTYSEPAASAFWAAAASQRSPTRVG
jgi:diguanylate cyclase (GGDEF)-like protein/PAS domain S-box-containing protein